MWGSDRLHADRQEVGKCSTRAESWGMYITFASAKKIANKAEPTLALKPRGDVTRNPKQGYQWPQKKGHVSAKNFKKKQKLINLSKSIFEINAIDSSAVFSIWAHRATLSPFVCS